MSTILKKLNKIEEELGSRLFEREDEIHGLIVALLSKSNILLLGEPGVAKSMIVKEFCNHIPDSKMFSYLLTKYTVPEELQGVPKLSKLKEDILERPIENTINDAEFVFLDEVFKGSSSILNTLLELANEKTFFNGGKKHKSPLLTMIGASNEIPEPGDGLEAFQDRFTLSYHVSPIKEIDNLVKAMKVDYAKEFDRTKITKKEIVEAQEAVNNIIIPDEVLSSVVSISRKLRNNKSLFISDRTVINLVQVLKAQCYLTGGTEVSHDHLTILVNCLWSDPSHINLVAKYVMPEASPALEKVEELKQKVREIEEAVAGVDANKLSKEDLNFQKIDFIRALKVIRSAADKFIATLKKGTPALNEAEKLSKYIEKVTSTLIDL